MQEKRPKLKLPYTKLEWSLELAALLLLLGAFVLTGLRWNALPDTVPTHFNGAGQPDGWGERNSLLILLIVNGVMYLLLSLLTQVPQYYNYTVTITAVNAPEQYRMGRLLILYLKTAVIGTFAYIQWACIRSALGQAQGLGIYFLPLTMLILFAPLGYYIYRSVRIP